MSVLSKVSVSKVTIKLWLVSLSKAIFKVSRDYSLRSLKMIRSRWLENYNSALFSSRGRREKTIQLTISRWKWYRNMLKTCIFCVILFFQSKYSSKITLYFTFPLILSTTLFKTVSSEMPQRAISHIDSKNPLFRSVLHIFSNEVVSKILIFKNQI